MFNEVYFVKEYYKNFSINTINQYEKSITKILNYHNPVYNFVKLIKLIDVFLKYYLMQNRHILHQYF